MPEIIQSKQTLLLVDDEWQEAFILWLQGLRSENTREAYFFAWMQFLATAQTDNPADIETKTFEAWKITLEKRYSPTTVNLRMSAISSFYKYILKKRPYLRKDNPCEGVSQLKVNPYGKATLLVDDQDIELLSSINQSTIEGKRDYTIILFYLTMGLRLAAIAKAQISNLRRQGTVLFFKYTGKGGKEYEKRLPSNTAKAILDYIELIGSPKSGSLFGMKRHQIQYMIETRCNDVFGKGHGIHVHSLRHTAANNAGKNGSVQDVRSLLDHESTRVTSVYLDHITKEQGERMAEMLDTRYGN